MNFNGDEGIPPIDLQIKFEKMSPQMENVLDYVTLLLITLLVYLYLTMFDFIIKRIIFFRTNNRYYLQVNDEEN